MIAASAGARTTRTVRGASCRIAALSSKGVCPRRAARRQHLVEQDAQGQRSGPRVGRQAAENLGAM